MVPLSGQKQASIGATWQVEVMEFPLLSIAVQLVQWEVKLALAGVISNVAPRIMAPMLISNSIFFFTSDSLFLPISWGDDGFTFNRPAYTAELVMTAMVGLVEGMRSVAGVWPSARTKCAFSL